MVPPGIRLNAPCTFMSEAAKGKYIDRYLALFPEEQKQLVVKVAMEHPLYHLKYWLVWYYLSAILDGYSRFMHRELYKIMKAEDVRRTAETAII